MFQIKRTAIFVRKSQSHTLWDCVGKSIHYYWCSCGTLYITVTDTAPNVAHKAFCILKKFRVLLSDNQEEQTSPHWQVVHKLRERVVQEMSWRCRQFSCRLCSKQSAVVFTTLCWCLPSAAVLLLSNQVLIQLLLKCAQHCSSKEKMKLWWHLIKY